MKNYSKLLISATLSIALSGYSYAEKNASKVGEKKVHSVMQQGCTQDLGAAYLEVNNVRARIMDEGDMWWDQGSGLPKYFVPAAGNVCAQFAAALWIGGYDAGQQLKEACMTYRQTGEDFWAGPLDTLNGSLTISLSDCQAWDQLFPCTRSEVEAFVASKDYSNPPTDIKNWPGSSLVYGEYESGVSTHLAPYIDVSGTGRVYTPTQGDYPAFDLTGNGYCLNELYGDKCLYWIINDEGNIHTETNGVPIGLEVHCEAFGFQTNDAINNMTFYHYQVINKSSFALYDTYFGFWDDFDLGNGADNYTGCDVGRNMGYGYSGACYDGDGTNGEFGYHDAPAAVGVVFFQGPKADTGSKEHYIKNGYIGMARFVYYNNDYSVQGNPTNQTMYYGYLTGFWGDGTRMTYGGNGKGGTLPCSYMFPWTPAGAAGGDPTHATNTDPTGYGTNGIIQSTAWDEKDAGNPPGDRRFIESAGPFTLTAGAVNYVIVGCVWDEPSTTGLCNVYPIGLIQQDADLAQGLFNNCFKVLNGPDAPDVATQALNQEIILTLSNSPTSNNYKEHYTEKSGSILPPFTDTDYAFQGYEIFQLIDSSVTASELLNDPLKARLVAQCDIQDNVANIINYVYNSALNVNDATLEVTGANKGIVHSFDIKTDQFGQDGENNLVNDRPYYYMAVAYGYNNYFPYNPAGPDTNLKYGQKLPFIQGRRNTKVYTVIPTIVQAASYGTVQNSVYGSGVPITRIEGHGNGTNVIELDQNSINYILQNDTMAHPSYVAGQGPISVKVVDPLSVVNDNFIVKFLPTASGGVTNSTRWELINQSTGEVDQSDTTIGDQYEQVFPQYGISIIINNVPFPSGRNQEALDSNSNLTFASANQNWLTGVASTSPSSNLTYWIRSGIRNPPSTPSDPDDDYVSYGNIVPDTNYDPNQYYNGMLGGTWAPYGLCAVSDLNLYCDNGPAWSLPTDGSKQPQLPTAVHDSIGNIASVDIVFTSDKSKWTRCIVLEEDDQPQLAEGQARKLDIRKSYSVDQNGTYAQSTDVAQTTDPTQASFISPTGMGWFPGYAINVETGERLNMAFGEDSWLTADNGRDMIWNPDSIMFSTGGYSGAGDQFGMGSVFGGKHYIYVFGHTHNAAGNYDYSVPAYDADQTIYANYQKNSPIYPWWKTRILDDVMWVNIPMLNKGHHLFECDATVRLRVQKPYDTAYGETFLDGGLSGIEGVRRGSTWRSATPDNNNFPMYSFSTAGLQVATNNSSAAQNALSLINIVPNPYYAYSGYESSGLDTRVRITNLPPVCSISIFTLNGVLIKVINKSNPETYADWTLQNQYNVPIASGLYLVHVAVPNVGEVTLKWFGVMRPLDLTTY